MITFQNIIFKLQEYWNKNNCIILQPLDIEVGSGTFHPNTFFYSLGKKHYKLAYIQPSRRPQDGRYGDNPNRLQHYYQFQVILKPSPLLLQHLYLDSLSFLGLNILEHDIRFIEDNWSSPTLGASGLGWEIWLDGMEITQITYFQQMGGIQCKPITCEITYGLERLAMHLQNIDDVYNVIWSKNAEQIIYYRDLFFNNEKEMSEYNFKEASIEFYLHNFNFLEKESERLLDKKLIRPAYEIMLKASHYFNILDARHAFASKERQRYILRIRRISNNIANLYCILLKK